MKDFDVDDFFCVTNDPRLSGGGGKDFRYARNARVIDSRSRERSRKVSARRAEEFLFIDGDEEFYRVERLSRSPLYPRDTSVLFVRPIGTVDPSLGSRISVGEYSA